MRIDMTRPQPGSVRRFRLIPLIALGSVLAACTSSPEAKPQAAADADLNELFAEVQRASRQMQETIRPFRDSGNLLGEVLTLRTMLTESEGASGMVRTMIVQQTSSAESFLGNHRQALDLYDRSQEPPTAEALSEPTASLDLSRVRAEPAIDVVIRAAAQSRAVVINEAHHVAQHRVLSRQLLPRLRALGFTHVAAEGLNGTDLELEERGYPTAATGYYLNEPLYADLVREALALGFEIVAYDQLGPPDVRERGQAKTLQEAIFSDPDARALIHVGYSHNLETPDSYGGAGAMAWHLRDLTGIDPLTIDQTRMRERGRPDLESPLFRQVAKAFELDQPTILVDAHGAPWPIPGAGRDLTVFSPPTREHLGRPHWLHQAGPRHPLALPTDLCERSESCLVEARLAAEGNDAVPIDRLEIRQDRPGPVLMVPADVPLRIRVLDADLNVLTAWESSGPTSVPRRP